MAQHCSVPACTSDQRYDKDNLLSFHCFPKDSVIKRAWIVKIRRDEGPCFNVTRDTKVCSKHFAPGEIVKTRAGRRKLVNDKVIPSVFEWTKEKRSRPSPKKRYHESEGDDTDEEEGIAEPKESDEPVETPAPADHDYHVEKRSTEELLAASNERVAELEAEISSLQGQAFLLGRFAGDKQAISFYTGFDDYATLRAVFEALQPTAVTMKRWTQVQRGSGAPKSDPFRDEALTLIDQFFIFLCRVRQGLLEYDLGIRFNVSQSTVSRILLTWVNYLYFMLGTLPLWPSRVSIDKHMPQCFRDTYKNTRVILDCTEVKVQNPSSKVLNSEFFSSYKSHTTFKGLIGITPCGMVSFVSALYTGAISDKEITRKSGIVELLGQGDQVMADKGFLISDLLQPVGSTLIIPPFLGLKGQFSRQEVTETQEIARLRIHVERAIRRVKEYHIFDGVLPLSLAGIANQLWTVCTILTNFKGPLF